LKPSQLWEGVSAVFVTEVFNNIAPSMAVRGYIPWIRESIKLEFRLRFIFSCSVDSEGRGSKTWPPIAKKSQWTSLLNQRLRYGQFLLCFEKMVGRFHWIFFLLKYFNKYHTVWWCIFWFLIMSIFKLNCISIKILSRTKRNFF